MAVVSQYNLINSVAIDNQIVHGHLGKAGSALCTSSFARRNTAKTDGTAEIYSPFT